MTQLSRYEPPLPTTPNLIEAGDGGGSGAVDQTLLRWVTFGLAGAGLALGLYIAVRPGIWPTAIALVIPPAVFALVGCSPASFEFRAHRNSTSVSLTPSIGLSMLGLFFADLFHAQVNPWLPATPAAVCAVLGFGVGWLMAATPGVQNRSAMVLVMGLCLGGYGYAATAVADIQFDASAGQMLRVPVLGKHVTYGRHSNSYYVELAPWGPRSTRNDVEVPSATYRSLSAGDAICVVQHPGALGMAWFTADVCPAPAPN